LFKCGQKNMSESFEARERRISQMENRLMALKSQQKESARKRETRRLILEGRLLENLIEWGILPQQLVTEKLDGWLTRDYDRSLFDLPPLETDQNAAPAAHTKGQKKTKIRQDQQDLPHSSPKANPTPPFTPPAHILQETGVSESEFLIH
jgi:hypothetical protein